MILFTFENYEYLAKPSGRFQLSRFANGELHCLLKTAVARKHCLILGSIAPPDENLLSFLLLADTCKKEKAASVTALLPYLAYTRQDKDKSGESLSNAWVSKLFAACGIDKIITVDLHSERNQKLSAIPIVSLSCAQQLAFELKKAKAGASILAPDQGAVAKALALASALKIKDVAFIKKTRTKNGVTHGKIVGPIGRKVILHDDMLDTGGTLVSAARRLNKQGASEIYVAITHGLFTGLEWKQLWKLGVKKIICTDSIPKVRQIKEPRIKIVSIAPLLRKAISRLL